MMTNNMNEELEFKFWRGDDFFKTLRFFNRDKQKTPYDLTGCRIDIDIEPNQQDDDAADPIIRLSTDNGALRIEENKLHLHIANRHTKKVTWKTAVFDVQVTDGNGFIKTIANGKIKLRHDTTRERE